MKQKIIVWFVVFISLLLVSLQTVLAADQYRPYLHNPEVPENPGLKLQGSYQTALWPGAATYSYGIEVPPGRNGLQPSVSISYNSHSTSQRPGIVGTAWALSQNYVWRDVDYSFADTSDDKFHLVLGGQSYELVYVPSEGRYHAKIESFLHITKVSGGSNEKGEYWIVKAKDGTTYRFGYNQDSELVSNIHNYVTRWSLDLVTDTHGNEVYYSYSENPAPNDIGAVYPSKIEYNNEKARVVEFVIESSDRPDKWMVYEQGNKIREARRIKEIVVKANGNLVRKYVLDYSSIGAKSFITSITLFGSDSTSSLPPTTFEYNGVSKGWAEDSAWAIPDGMTYRLKKDNGFRLVDLNRDGLVDIEYNDEQSWLNKGGGLAENWAENSAWNAPHPIVDSNQYDTGMRFVELNGDGLTDIVRADGPADADRDAWINTGSGWSYDATWHLPTGAHPINEDDDNFDRGIRFDDVNGDGLTDILGNAGSYQSAWINTGNGWTKVDGSWAPPPDAEFVDSLSNPEDQGVREADVNGDGLPDLLHGEGGTRETWLNTGNGWALDNTYAPPVPFVKTVDGQDEGGRLADVNGDGLPDILYGKGNEKSAWINTGAGWVQDDAWNIPELAKFTEADGDNKGLRIADVNGDGVSDLVKISPERKTWLSKASRPYLLKAIHNELGGKTSIEYGQSSVLDNTGDDNLPDLGFNMWIVDKAVRDNGVVGAQRVLSKTDYTYFDGLYDYDYREFRGFNKVQEVQAGNSITTHWFHQDDALKGREFRTELFDSSSNPFRKTELNWIGSSKDGYNLVQLSSETNYLYDGSNLEPRATGTNYDYDTYGNVVSSLQLGETKASGDEKNELWQFAYNTDSWIVDRKIHYTLSGPDGKAARQTFYRYDDLPYGTSPVKGDLTWEEQWLESGDNQVATHKYDDHGNLVETKNPRGFATTYQFGINDPTFTFSEKTVNSAGHAFLYSYDFGTGNLLSETDANGNVNSHSYDAFGRIKKDILPYDSDDYPTKEYTYTFDGTAPEGIKVSQREVSGAAGTLDTYYFYDGFGKLVQVRGEAENSEQVVTNFYYDLLGRLLKLGNPYFTPAAEDYTLPDLKQANTSYTYDALSRVVEIENPDRTFKTIGFDRWKITPVDEKGNKKTYDVDAYSQIKRITDYVGNNNYATEYSYDSAGNVARMKDAQGNGISYDYDSLGRKIKQEDPDLGTLEYSYDKNGNLVSTTDNSGIVINMKYDDLDRVVEKSSEGEKIMFFYDNVKGTLSRAESSDMTVSYDYDNRLRKVKETTNIDGMSFTTGWEYDTAGRVTKTRMPDGSETVYDYNSQGLVDGISGILTAVDYNAVSTPFSLSYGNGLVTSYSYDPDNFRTHSIKTGDVQELLYSYDASGNIAGINDNAKGVIESMDYDGLDRLAKWERKSAEGQKQLAFAYDPLGDIVSVLSESGGYNYYYGNSPRHSAAKITAGSDDPDNPEQPPDHNTTNTTIYDDFDDGIINSSIWTESDWSGGVLAEADGALHFETGSSSDRQIRTNTNLAKYGSFNLTFKIKADYVSGDKNSGFWLGNLAEGQPGESTGHRGYYWQFHGRTKGFNIGILYDDKGKGIHGKYDTPNWEVGKWHLIRIEKSGASMKFFFDEELVGEDNEYPASMDELYWLNGRTWKDPREGESASMYVDNFSVSSAMNIEEPTQLTIISPVENLTFYEGNLITLNVVADYNGDGDLSYSISDSRFDQNNNVFKWQTGQDDAGVYPVALTVSDGRISDTSKINISVKDVGAGTSIFDNFDDGVINDSIWLHSGWSGGTLTESDGNLYFETGSSNDQQIRTLANIGAYDNFTLTVRMKIDYVSDDKNSGFWLGNLAEGQPGESTGHRGYYWQFHGKTRGFNIGARYDDKSAGLHGKDGPPTWEPGRWHDIKVERTDGVARFYFDGALVGTDSTFAPLLNELYWNNGRTWKDLRGGEEARMHVDDFSVSSTMDGAIGRVMPLDVPDVIYEFIDLTNASEITVYNNETRIFSIVAEDPDSDILTYTWLLDGDAVANSQNFTFTPGENENAKHNITLVADDGKSKTNASFVLSVIDAPDCLANIDTKLCPLQLGVCAGSSATCDSRGKWPSCTAATYFSYSSKYEVNENSCDSFDNDCDGGVDEGQEDYEHDGIADCVDDDKDDDDVKDDEDDLIGKGDDINFTGEDKNVKIDIEEDKDDNGEDNGRKTKHVRINNSGKPLLQFNYNFSKGSILLRNLTIEKQKNGSKEGFTLVKGLDLKGKRKEVFVDRLVNGSNAVCIKDREVAAITEVTSDCSSEDEMFLKCDFPVSGPPYERSGWRCGSDGAIDSPEECEPFSCQYIKETQQYQIFGLKHSAVMEACTDADLDTYLPVGCSGGSDCNDNSNSMNPAAAEVCNSVDDNCNGQVDEDRVCNTAPILQSISNMTVSENSAMSFTVAATDNENDDLAYNATDLPQGASFDNATAAFTWTPGFTQSGVYAVAFNVSDGLAYDYEKINITVTNTNRAPVFENVGNKTVLENAELGFTVSVTDPDGDPLTQLFVNVPEKLASAQFSSSTKEFKWAPTFDDSGTYSIWFTARDGQLSTNEFVNVTVANVNRAPAIMLLLVDPPDLVMGEGETKTFSADIADADNDTVTIAWRVNGETVSTQSNMEFSPEYNGSGEYAVEFSISDYEATTTTTMQLTVQDTLECGTSQTRLCTLQIGVCESSFETCSSPGHWPGCAPSDYGSSYSLEEKFCLEQPNANGCIALCDSRDNDCDGNVDEGRACNTAPQLQAIGNRTVNENSGLAFAVSATDGESDILSYNASGLPLGASFGNSSKAFEWAPSFEQAGTYAVKFGADDGLLAGSEEINISVVNVNRAPLIAPIGNQTVNENSTLNFKLDVTDPDGDRILGGSMDVGTAEGLRFDEDRLEAVWAPSFEQAGDYAVRFSFNDGELSSAYTVVNITVINVNRPPVISSVYGNFAVNETEISAITVVASDPDGEDISFSVNDSKFVPIGDAGEFAWQTGYDDAGGHVVLASVSDGSLTAQYAVAINVGNVNRPPLMGPVGNATIRENLTLEFVLDVSEPDNDALEVDAINVSGNTTGFSFDSGTHTFTWTPSFEQSGNYGFMFTASDGNLSVQKQFNVTVLNVNRAPYIGSIQPEPPGLVMGEGESKRFRLVPEIFDPDGDKFVSLWYVNGGLLSNRNDRFSFQSRFDGNGTYNVTLVATDNMSETNAVTMLLVVEDTMECVTLRERKSCQLQLGVCAGSIQHCGSSGRWPGCAAADYVGYSASYEEAEVACDGLDNDCDGDVDENPICTLRNNWTDVSGKWSVSEEGFAPVWSKSYAEHALIVEKNESFEDVQLKARVKVNFSSPEVGLCGRLSPDGKGYCINYGWGMTRQVVLSRLNGLNNDGSLQTPVQMAAGSPLIVGSNPSDEELYLKLQLNGNTVKGKVWPVGGPEPDWFVQSGTDTMGEPLISGFVGYYAYNINATFGYYSSEAPSDSRDEGGECSDGDDDGQQDAGCGGTDCNDNDESVYLGASEGCNGVDDDCDAEVDEGCALGSEADEWSVVNGNWAYDGDRMMPVSYGYGGHPVVVESSGNFSDGLLSVTVVNHGGKNEMGLCRLSPDGNGYCLGYGGGGLGRVKLARFDGFPYNPATVEIGPDIGVRLKQPYRLKLLFNGSSMKGKVWHADEEEPDWQVQDRSSRYTTGTAGYYTYYTNATFEGLDARRAD